MNRRRRGGRGPDVTNRTPDVVDLRAWWGVSEREDASASADDDGTELAAAIRPTPDPGAVPRSLGDPPLTARPGVAEAHLVAVYEEAVRAATALAAANRILATDTAEDEGT